MLGHGVSTCATCDGFFFRGHEIVVVGGGDSAIEEALFLTQFAARSPSSTAATQLRASKIMQDRAFANEKIRFLWNTVVEDLSATSKVEGVRVREREDRRGRELPAPALFVAIGHTPNTDLFKGQLDMDDTATSSPGRQRRTNVEGVFACGDVQDHVYRQAVTAAGTGCMAAIDAERWLEARSDVHDRVISRASGRHGARPSYV